MKTKLFKKVISLALAISMIATLFVGLNLAPMTVSAANTDMLVFEASGGGRFVNYRPNTGIFNAGARYLYAFDIDYSDAIDAQLASGDRKESHYWKINYFNTSNTWAEIALANLTIVKTALTHGDHYDVTFTAPSDARDYNNISLIFGDFWYNGCDQYFKVGNLNLWKIDSSGNKLSQISLTMPGSIDSVVTVDKSGSNSAYKQARTGSNTNWACPKGYRNGFSFTAQNGYFDPIGGEEPELGDYTDGSSSIVRFVYGEACKLRYINTERTLEAGAYELGFNWKILRGNGAYLKLTVGGEVIIDASIDTSDPMNTNDDYAAEDYYNESDFTRKVYFELEDDATGIEIIIGNSDTTTASYVSGGYLKVWDDDLGEPTGGNKIHNLSTDNKGDRNASTLNKWCPQASMNSSVDFRAPKDGVFTAAGAASRRVTFKSANDWCRLVYNDYTTTLTAGTTYKVIVDCRQFSATALYLTVSGMSGTKEYDDINRKLYYTFTPSSDTTGFTIILGNYDTAVTASIGHAYLYALDGSGEPVGDSLVADIDAFTLDLTKNNNTNYSQIWNTAGYTADNSLYIGTIPENYFQARSAASYMAHFYAGYENGQVLAYKDPDTFLAAGTYRLTLDVNNLGTGTPTVQLRSGQDIGDSYNGTLVAEDGYSKTYQFTVSSAARGVGVFLGNYYHGDDVDVIFKNPVLYEYKNDNTVGYNYFEPLDSFTYQQRGWAPGGRPGINSCRWSPLNCSSAIVTVGDVDTDYFQGAIVDTGTPKMANIYHGFNYRTFIYNDAGVSLQKGSTYVFTVNQKVASGSPTINIYDSTGGSNNNINNATYTSSYNDVTSGYTRTITFTMAKTVSTLRIRIGNYSDNTDVAASFANVSLVKQGTGTNLIAGFTSDNFVKDKNTNRKWWVASQQSGNNVITHDTSDIPQGYFSNSPKKNMYYISDVSTAYSGLEYNAKLEASTTYTLEFDWRNYGGAYPKVSATYYNGSAWPTLTQTATSANKVDGVTTALSGNLLPATVMNTSHYGHYAVTFTTPADISDSGYRNVNILFANVITGDDYMHYTRGSTYYGNFSLQKNGVSGNAILNGDLSIVDKTGLVDKNDTGKFHGFVIGIGKDNGKRDLYNDLAILPQPDNFFTLAGASYQKTVKFNGGDYDYFRQEMRLESNTQYVLCYNYTFVNAENGAYIQQVDTGNNFSTPATQTWTDDDSQIKYMVFTTGTLRDTYYNFLLNMFIGRNAPDASFYFTNVKIRKWNGSQASGPNLVDNAGFYFGGEAKEDNSTQINIPASEEKVLTRTNTLQLLGWKTFGKFDKNSSIEVINTPSSFFTSYKSFEARTPLLRKMLLDFEDRGYHPYEDINQDSSFDVIDYVHTKLAWLESNGSATTTAAEAFKETYVNGNNTTNIDSMSTSLFGNNKKPTGTTYYVDADNGSDSNNGKSQSKAWQTLNKVNTASLSSGDVVLFKCGCYFRPKLNDCSSTNWSGQAALRCQNGVTYGSYGSGNKPVILGSYYNYKSRTWTQDSTNTNVWKTSINLSGYYHCNDVGIIIFNYGSFIGNMTLSKAALAKEGDFFCRAPDGTDGGDGYVYVYCTENPKDHWKSIEIGQKRHICRLANNVTINNICFKYGGWHGLQNTNLSNVCISNCEISYIGGCYSNSRLGNGVEFGQTGSNCRVKNCYVRECYDAGLTFQCWSGTGSFENISFMNNLIENCNYSIEFFVENASDKMNGIYLNNNICRGAGYGWSYDEREGYGPAGEIGCFRTSHIRCTQDIHYTNLSDFYIQNNVFDCAKGALIYWWWNATDAATTYDTYSGLHISGNTLYQAARKDDDRIIQFKDEKGVYGSSTYGVREALKLFEGTQTPSKLNESKYLVSERVISTY